LKSQNKLEKQLKIAIYSGSIPSTTFVEHLIIGIAKQYKVHLYGVINKTLKYNSKNIHVFNTPKTLFVNVVVSFCRILKLMFLHPKRIIILFQEIKKQKGIYSQWIVFTRLLPVVLHLPDVFHVQWAKDLERFMFLKEKLNVKLILSLRGAHINYSPIANQVLAESYKQNFPKIDAFHAVSKAISIEAQKYNADASKIKVIHSPLPKRVFEFYKPFKKSNSNSIKICVVGRFHWIKGMRYLFDALYQLKQKGIQFKCICITSNKISEEALFQINQLEITKSIQFKRDLNPNELFNFMQSCDMLILPSLKEGIANVVLEAMAIGLPVISTNCGGMSEAVEHKKTGFLVPVRNVEAIVNAVVEYDKMPEKELQTITQNAHDFVKKQFNANDSLKQFNDLYQSVLD